MAGKIYNVKITNSPSNSNLEVAGDLVIKLYVPYSDDSVTIKINPYLKEYKEKVTDNLRQYTEFRDTKDTKTLLFDFQNSNVNEINCENKNYEIKLMNIGKVSENGKDFKTFEFMISEK